MLQGKEWIIAGKVSLSRQEGNGSSRQVEELGTQGYSHGEMVEFMGTDEYNWLNVVVGACVISLTFASIFR